MNRAIRLRDIALRTITVIKFYENYVIKCGRLSREAYKDKLEQAPTFYIHMEPSPRDHGIDS